MPAAVETAGQMDHSVAAAGYTMTSSSLRHIIVGRLQRRLEQQGYPRLQMAVLVALTGGAGFLCSFTMLTYGVDAMWQRYLVSVGVAYLAFLTLLWSWIRISGPTYVDPRDLTRLDAPDSPRRDPWPNRPLRDRSGILEMIDPEGGWLLMLMIMLLVFLGTMLLVSFYVVYAAPVLFAELILDGLLAATLYHRLRTVDVRYWLGTAIRRTYASFLAAGIILMVMGWVMGHAAPGAKSVGEVLQHLMR
jgi:hypothetical protein